MIQLKDYKFQTPTVTICEPNRFERYYDGPVEKIPEIFNKYYVFRVIINKVIHNTYMEVVAK